MYAVRIDLADSESYAGTLYLPGAPVPMFDSYPAVDTLCPACDNPLSEAGSADPATGRAVWQDPRTGRHDGILTHTYAPMPGARPMECDPWHLRCAVEMCAAGCMAIIVGPDPDPERVATGRHLAAV